MAEDSKKKFKKNGAERISWRYNKECMLLDLWEENITSLRGSRKNTHIYNEMAESLSTEETLVQWSDVKVKMDNMMRKNREEKKLVGPSGGSPSSWPHFQKINNLGGFKPYNLADTIVESTNLSNLSEIIDYQVPSTSNRETSDRSESDTPSLPKRKKTDASDRLKERMLELAEIRTKNLTALGNETISFRASLSKLFEQNTNKEKQ